MTAVDIYHTTIDVDLTDVWDSADNWERAEFVEQYRERIAPYLGGEVASLLEDPVKRLEVIVALRGLGYSVEFA